MSKKPDLINDPPHYKSGNGTEAIDVIEGFDLNFHIGNAVKYLLRLGRKADDADMLTRIATKIDDLKKARWYIDREIVGFERSLEFWKKLNSKIERDNRRSAQKRRRKR